MSELQPADIYTEPHPVDFDTLANLGPLRAMAGVWEGTRGLDVKPKAEGPKKQAYVERISLQPIDPVTNGPQLLYGLRYHTHITKPDQVKTYHEQVGYWLWEPATGAVVHTLTIPRGQTAMAAGNAAPDATRFTLQSMQGHEHWGICSTPFLENNFRTVGFTITVQVHEDGSWGYEEDTVLMVRGQDQPFHHTDRNLLRRVAAPTPNPLVRPA